MEWMLMPLRRYAEFSGRSRRKEYWMFSLMLMIVYSVLAGLMISGGLIGAMDGVNDPELGPTFWLGVGLAVLVSLAIIVPSVAVTIRRLHDRDMSGWWYLGIIILGSIPYVGALVNIGFLVLMCLPGTPGPNRFGDDPKNPVGYDVFA